MFLMIIQTQLREQLRQEVLLVQTSQQILQLATLLVCEIDAFQDHEGGDKQQPNTGERQHPENVERHKPENVKPGNVKSYDPANVESYESKKVPMKSEVVFVFTAANIGEEDDKGETPLQFDEED